MKDKVLKILVAIETFIIVLELLWMGFCFWLSSTNGNRELLREYSPDGKYVLHIKEIATSDWLFGGQCFDIRLYESADPGRRVSFRTDIRSRGARAGYEVTWLEDGVQIALIGKTTSYYILLFPGVEKTQGGKEDAASKDVLLTKEKTTEEQKMR